MYKKLGLCALTLLAFGCQSNKQEEITRFHEDGRAKPTVVLVPMIDSTSYDIPWSLSDEFLSLVQNDIEQLGELYLLPKEEYESAKTKGESPFATDLGWIKEAFASNEFIVFTEMVEHADIPANLQNNEMGSLADFQETSYNLNMKLRVRIIDNRGARPKVILQEYITNSYFVPKNLIRSDYNKVIFGTTEYNSTPMSIAHTVLASELVKRISDYILLAKSR